MLTLYITRHGQTVWNVQSRMQGWADSPLTEVGITAAKQLGARLHDVPFDAVYSSTSGRTLHTAELIIGEREVLLCMKDDLREINIGEWQGLLSADIESKFAEQLKTYFERPSHYESTSGENFHILKERVVRAIDEIALAHPNGHVLVVTHGVVKKCLINHFSGANLDSLWEPPFIHRTSLTVLEIDTDRRELTMIGDMAHAEDAKRRSSVQ